MRWAGHVERYISHKIDWSAMKVEICRSIQSWRLLRALCTLLLGKPAQSVVLN